MITGYFYYNSGGKSNEEEYFNHNDERWKIEPSYLTNDMPNLDDLVHYSTIPFPRKYVELSLRMMPRMKKAVLDLYLRSMPGPLHWVGTEGGSLGLPTDVSKLILKWI